MYEAVEVFVKDGIGLCMDDFGSGYANLNAVLKLPFQCIKMDRSMLNGIRQHKVAGEFYRNIVTILRQQGYAIVAEEVERAGRGGTSGSVGRGYDWDIIFPDRSRWRNF